MVLQLLLVSFKEKNCTMCKLSIDALVMYSPAKKLSKKPSSSSPTTILLKTSAAIVTRKKERGSLSLKPLDVVAQPLGSQFTRMENFTKYKHS